MERGMRVHSTVNISIHAPVKGATAASGSTSLVKSDFNPRTREGCDCMARPPGPAGRAISIHAPVKGATMNGYGPS